MKKTEERYGKTSEDVINFFNEINKTQMTDKISFLFISDSEAKELITIKKINDKFKFVLERDLIVTINEDLFDKFDDISKKLLIEEELSKVNFNYESGKISIGKADFVTNMKTISKYGIDTIARAKNIEVETLSQMADFNSYMENTK